MTGVQTCALPICYGALAASVLSPDMVFNFLVNSSGAIMLFIYLLIAWAQLRLRARFEVEAPGALKLKMWFHPYGTWMAMAGMVGVLVLMGLSPSHSIELWASVLVAAGVMAAWWIAQRQRGISAAR